MNPLNKIDPLGYDSNEQGMLRPTELAPQRQAKNLYNAAMDYFNGLEATAKTEFGALLKLGSIDLKSLTAAEDACKKTQSRLSNALFEECRKYKVATARIGGKLFTQSDDSFYTAVVNAYTDLVALDRAAKEARKTAEGYDREGVLRSLTSYVEQYNGREPPQKLALGHASQSYAAHFANIELADVVLNALDRERTLKTRVELPENGDPAWRKLGHAVADKYKVLFDVTSRENQEKLTALRKGANETVTNRTTSMFKIPKIEGL